MIRTFSLALFVGLFGSDAAGQTTEVGKSQYQARCVGCHGEDGTGGGQGPNIVDLCRPGATTVEALSSLILKGIPDAGMPALVGNWEAKYHSGQRTATSSFEQRHFLVQKEDGLSSRSEMETTAALPG